MHFKYKIYLLYVTIHLTNSKTCSKSKSKSKSARNNTRTHLDLTIMGGFEVEIHNYPYNAQYGSSCGAAIIHEKWAITAQHCRPFKFIRVGSKVAGAGKNIPVKNTIGHSEWLNHKKIHDVDYDYRLLELDKTLDFKDPNIQPIKIAHRRDITVGKLVTVTGWGYIKHGGSRSSVLRAVEVPIVSNKQCRRVRFPLYKVTPRMFCAGYGEGPKDACQGDSGSPAVADGRLFGTVSFGFGCGVKGAYGVYSNIAEVRDWIITVTGLKLD